MTSYDANCLLEMCSGSSSGFGNQSRQLPAFPSTPITLDPTSFDREQCQQLLESLDPEQIQQLWASLSPQQQEQFRAQGIDPDTFCGFCGGSSSSTNGRHDDEELRNPYVELKGDACVLDSERVLPIVRGLRGKGTLKFVTDNYYRVRHADQTSPIYALSECGDARCGAHRLKHPEVRSRFRDFITKTVRKAKRQCTAWWTQGLRYASLGSGHLLWDLEILERLRAEGVEIKQICLIDQLYAEPDAATQFVLKSFADWQTAVANMQDEKTPQILAFKSSQAYFHHCARGGIAFGCNLFMHCDAAFAGSDEESWRLATKALVDSGLFVRLNNLGAQTVPEEMLEKGPEMLRKYWQCQQKHSEEPFSAAAWLAHGDGDLEPIEDFLLGGQPEEKAYRHFETGERFKQAELDRAELIGLEIWRVKAFDAVKSYVMPSSDAATFGEFSRGEKLIAAERNGDWIRVACTSDLWGVTYSAQALAATAAPMTHGMEPGAAEPKPIDDSSIWVPIDSSCFGPDSDVVGRFLIQTFVPPGRMPWQPGAGLVDAHEKENLLIVDGNVALRAPRSNLASDWCVPPLQSPAARIACGSARWRQRERRRWRATVHELNGAQCKKALLGKLSTAERDTLRAWLHKEGRRWQALAAELATLTGWARKERLASLGVEDRAAFQQWLAEQRSSQGAKPKAS